MSFRSTTTSMTDKFEHSRLSSWSLIRVLDLLPSRNRDSPLQCQIREIALDSHRVTAYEALSYVWGEPSGYWPVSCNGQELLVTKNCQDALFHMRRKFGKRTLWIDSICIDQTDTAHGIEERSREIKKMGEIFQKAKRVVIWLGPGDAYTPTVFRYLKSLGRLVQVQDIGSAVETVLTPLVEGIHDVMEDTGRGGSTKNRESYRRLLDNAWFVRVWTVQECAVAQECLVMCGRSTIDWTVFKESSTASSASLINHSVYYSILSRYSLSSILKDNEATMVANAAPLALDFQSMDPKSRSNELQLLGMIGNLQATIAQDRIYSLYSVLYAVGIVMPSPDYNKSVSEVFQEATLAYIQHRQKLAILTITHPPGETSGFPSWVPDWLTPAQAASVTADETGVYHCNKGARRTYWATQRSRPMLTDIGTPGRLALKGKLLGKIRQRISCSLIGSERVHEEDGHRQFTKTCMEWCRMISAMKDYPFTGEDSVHAACGAILSHDSPYFKLRVDVDEYFLLWYELMMYDGQQRQIHGENVSDLADVTDSDMTTQEPVDVVLKIIHRALTADKYSFAKKVRYVNRYIQTKANYALFLLDAGYLGAAFHTCQEGDELALLAGLDSPVLLRRQSGNQFRVVVPAYCHGVMDGERWNEDEDEEKLEEIVLV
ncbi:heterokaryon incompatibility protein-domain-containing protein [Xylariales sp. AK1849]|nr:heterokaryon incompatibility protein-domain-containing protein [Xylariales sp. AK1849]